MMSPGRDLPYKCGHAPAMQITKASEPVALGNGNLNW
jgi:hypothetical protein